MTLKKVIVGPGPCDLNPSTAVPLSIGSGDQIGWATNPPGQSLSIVFKRSGFPPNVSEPPFQNMTQNANGDWVVPNPSQSGPINPKVKTSLPSGGGLTFKYDQILGKQSCDGRIIIDW